jgi:hypothetical protein
MRCKAEVACVQFQLQFQFSFSSVSVSAQLACSSLYCLCICSCISPGERDTAPALVRMWDAGACVGIYYLLFTIYYSFIGAFALSLDSERALCSLCFLLRSGVTLFPAREADKLCVEACCNLALALAWLFASHGYVSTSWTMTQPNATHAR